MYSEIMEAINGLNQLYADASKEFIGRESPIILLPSLQDAYDEIKQKEG